MDVEILSSIRYVVNPAQLVSIEPCRRCHPFLLSTKNHMLQVTTYSFETHSKTAQIRVLNIQDGSSHLISEDVGASEPVWISDTEVAFLKSHENSTDLLYQDIETQAAE